MSWFASIDDDGIIEGFYNNDFQAVPEGARPISEDQYQDWLAKGRYYYWWPRGDKNFSIRPVSNEEKLSKAKPQKSAEIKAKCSEAISSGFTSEALGKVYRYPTGETDKENVANAFLNGLESKQSGDDSWKSEQWCFDPDNETWAFQEHNADQMIQVGKDMNAFIQGIRKHYADLAVQIEDATTEAQVLAVKW
jgi:hypothetical protein